MKQDLLSGMKAIGRSDEVHLGGYNFLPQPTQHLLGVPKQGLFSVDLLCENRMWPFPPVPRSRSLRPALKPTSSLATLTGTRRSTPEASESSSEDAVG